MKAKAENRIEYLNADKYLVFLIQGGNRCFWLEFKNSLPSSVTSGWATFGAYGSVKVRRISDDDFTMFGKEIPRKLFP